MQFAYSMKTELALEVRLSWCSMSLPGNGKNADQLKWRQVHNYYYYFHGVIWSHCSMPTDRKKDLVKLQFGEYVSLGKVEATLSQSQYVETLCVYAESSKTYTVCLVVPRQKNLNALAASLNLDTSNWKALCQNQLVKEAVLKDLHAVGKACEYCVVPWCTCWLLYFFVVMIVILFSAW